MPRQPHRKPEAEATSGVSASIRALCTDLVVEAGYLAVEFGEASSVPWPPSTAKVSAETGLWAEDMCPEVTPDCTSVQG